MSEVPPVHVDVYGRTDAGRVRKENEDHFVIVSLRKAMEIRQTSLPDPHVFDQLHGPEALLFVVADGVGGHFGGELASGTAVTSVVEFVGQAAGCFHSLDVDREHEFLGQLETAVERAHEKIVQEHGSRGQSPATTLTLAALVWPRAYLVHVGDSRALYMRNGRLRHLTRDQTMGQFMVDSGAWTEEQAQRARPGATLISAVGGPEMNPSVGLIDLLQGDVLLLCTDGLTKHVPDERITEILGQRHSAEVMCQELVDAALTAGGTDNVTAIVARMGA